MIRLPLRIAVFYTLAILLCSDSGVIAQPGISARVQAIRYWSFGDVTRIAVQTQGEYKLFSDQIDRPARVYFDLTGLRPPATAHHGIQTIAVEDRLLRQIRVAEISPGKTRIVFDLESPAEVVSSQLVNPDRLMIELRPKTAGKPTVSLARSTTRVNKIDLASAPDGSTMPSVSPAKTEDAERTSKQSGQAGARPPIVVLENSRSRVPDVRQTEPSREDVAAPPDTAAPPHHEAASHMPLAVTTTPAAATETTVETVPGPLTSSYESPPTGSTTGKLTGAVAPATRSSSGDRSLVRVLGLKLGRVVIDAGHGGHDTGTIGPGGLMEKDLVLDVALRLGKLITQQLGAEVIYTRSGDVFIPLEERTKIANNQKADLFISIHANSSPEQSATGVETYYFNLTSDKTGLDLATRENASSVSSISDLNDLLHKAVLENKLEESREFAQRVQSALWTSSVKMNGRSRDRGVRQAPFVVLIGATMPSILAEIGFVSNPHDERLLRRNDQRQKIAEALLKGVSRYASTLSHVQIARAR